MKKFVIIVGPTGSGKTTLSLEIASHFHGEIINGDSVQVYQGLDIGSAKIKEDEKRGIKHHLLDIKDPHDSYSVYEFQHDVRKLIENIPFPIIVGGTGFYINAAISHFEFVEEKRDTAFDRSYDHLSNEELYQELIKYDPEITIDLNNRRRVLRALEQALAGTPRSKKIKKDERLYHPLIIYLDVDRKILTDLLWQRLEKQIKDGFIEEVERLRDQDIHINAIGYREIDSYLAQELTFDEMKDAIIKASKMLAKKQKTYFINQMHPHVFDALSKTLTEDVIQLIKDYMEENV
jgi:tRNA dimethylallyltransferase